MGRIATGKPSTRPSKEIDWKKVDDLLISGCLGTEIASYFDMHPDTFYRKVEEQQGMGFTDYSAQKKPKGEALIRLKQFNKALSEKGDTQMLIWLGRNRLGQTDKIDKETKDFIQEQIFQAIKEINGESSPKPEADSGAKSACKSTVENEQSLLDKGQRRKKSKVSDELGSGYIVE